MRMPIIFKLVRRIDSSGISGLGVVADGVEFPDGHVVVRWRAGSPQPGVKPTTVIFSDIAACISLHGHGADTWIEFYDGSKLWQDGKGGITADEPGIAKDENLPVPDSAHPNYIIK